MEEDRRHIEARDTDSECSGRIFRTNYPITAEPLPQRSRSILAEFADFRVSNYPKIDKTARYNVLGIALSALDIEEFMKDAYCPVLIQNEDFFRASLCGIGSVCNTCFILCNEKCIPSPYQNLYQRQEFNYTTEHTKHIVRSYSS